MKQYSVIFFFILLFPLTAFTQKGDWLRVKMKNADSVVLVSHEVTAGVVIVDSAGNHFPLPKLIIGGRPNYAIVKEKQIVNGGKLDTLIRILARPFLSRTIETAKCFMPHHAVFIIKNGRTSYIDICFGCLGFETSKDLRRLYAFDLRKWEELEDFFVKLGFTYRFPDQ